MCHISVARVRRTTIRELKHDTTTVLSWVERGETVEVRRRDEPVAVLSPVRRRGRPQRPDFLARLKAIYGPTRLEFPGTDVVSEARGDA